MSLSVLPPVLRDTLVHDGTPHVPTPSLFPPGSLTVLVGGAAGGWRAVESLILEAAMDARSVLLVCGDERLDAYGLLARARAAGVEDAVADGVLLARAFTVHQFVALVDETLPVMARERSDTGLAVVTGLVGLFLDEDVRDNEARLLFARCLQGLATWTSKQPFPVLATTDRPTTARAAALLELASTVAGRRVEADRLDARLLAPSVPPPRLAPAQAKLEAF